MRDIVRQKTGTGFTLLELLIAIFIFAIVMAAVYGVYRTIVTVTDSVESQADIDNKARTAMTRISADLESCYPGDGSLFVGRRQEISGSRADTLKFTSTAHLTFDKKEPPAGLAVISYGVAEDTGTKLLQLFRLDIPYRPGFLAQDYSDKKGYLLCDGLRAVRFTYYDQAGNEVDEWQAESDGVQAGKKTRRLPVMIEVVLRFPGGDGNDLVFKTAVALPSKKNQRGRPPDHEENTM